MIERANDEPRKPLKIALVNLRSRPNDWHHTMMVPMGLMYVSAALKQAFGDRLDIRQFDMMTCPHGEEGHDAARAFLEEVKADVVGIRGFSTQSADFPVVASMAKEVRPDCVTIAGGPHAQTGSRELFVHEAIDFVCTGEGEETFVEFIGNLLEGRSQEDVLGLGWAENGEMHCNPPRPLIQDVDALPLPDYSIIDLEAYQGYMTMTDLLAKGRVTSIFTSRGCPYQCTYCHNNFGKKFRYRSVENVIDELDYLIHEHGLNEFLIIDDIFNANRKRAMAIFDEVVRRNWKIWFAFPNALRGDLMDEEFIIAAKEAGVYHWALAVETATPRLQKLIKKNNNLDRLFETIELSDKHGIFVATFNMLGFPTETEEEMLATIDYNIRSKAHILHMFVVTPYVGTPLFDGLYESGAIEDPTVLGKGAMNFTEDNVEPDISEVPKARIEEIMVDAIGRFHFDGRRLRRMLDLTSWGHNHAHLAVHIERRRWSAGLDYAILADRDREAARLLALLNSTAKRMEPELCHYLPDPPEDLLAEAIAAQGG